MKSSKVVKVGLKIIIEILNFKKLILICRYEIEYKIMIIDININIWHPRELTNAQQISFSKRN